MEFKDLPSDVQKTAAHTLHSVLREIGKDIASEPAKDLARKIKTAFVELYNVGTDSETVETKTVSSPIFSLEPGNDSNLLIVFYVQIMPDDFVMQLHRF